MKTRNQALGMTKGVLVVLSRRVMVYSGCVEESRDVGIVTFYRQTTETALKFFDHLAPSIAFIMKSRVSWSENQFAKPSNIRRMSTWLLAPGIKVDTTHSDRDSSSDVRL